MEKQTIIIASLAAMIGFLVGSMMGNGRYSIIPGSGILDTRSGDIWTPDLAKPNIEGAATYKRSATF
jgi:hypothetical protein